MAMMEQKTVVGGDWMIAYSLEELCKREISTRKLEWVASVGR